MLRQSGTALCVVLLAIASPALSATTPVPVPATEVIAPATPPAIPENATLLPANSVVELEMLDTVSSATSKRGDFFRMRVVHALRAGDFELVPAGTVAVGQVVHAQKAGMGGKAGELILAARYLETPQGQVPLHSTLGAVGVSRTTQSMAVSVALGPLGLVVKGKTVSLPAGSTISVRVAADTLVTPSPAKGESSSTTP